jgi:hypothetical protein
MNQKQRQYAIDRIQEKFRERQMVLRQKHTAAPKKPTDDQIMEYIKYHNPRLKPEATPKTPIGKAYDLRKMPVPSTLDQAAFDKAVDAEKEKLNKALDLIALGNEQAALEAIRNY